MKTACLLAIALLASTGLADEPNRKQSHDQDTHHGANHHKHRNHRFNDHHYHHHGYFHGHHGFHGVVLPPSYIRASEIGYGPAAINVQVVNGHATGAAQRVNERLSGRLGYYHAKRQATNAERESRRQR